MPEIIYKAEEISFIEQVLKFTNELTEQQQQRFSWMIEGAKLAKQLNIDEKEEQTT